MKAKVFTADDFMKEVGSNPVELEGYISKINESLKLAAQKRNLGIKLKVVFKEDKLHDILYVKSELKRAYEDAGYNVRWQTEHHYSYQDGPNPIYPHYNEDKCGKFATLVIDLN